MSWIRRAVDALFLTWGYVPKEETPRPLVFTCDWCTMEFTWERVNETDTTPPKYCTPGHRSKAQARRRKLAAAERRRATDPPVRTVAPGPELRYCGCTNRYGNVKVRYASALHASAAASGPQYRDKGEYRAYKCPVVPGNWHLTKVKENQHG